MQEFFAESTPFQKIENDKKKSKIEYKMKMAKT